MQFKQHSPELLAANELLYHMRAKYKAERNGRTATAPLDNAPQQESTHVSRLINSLDLAPAGSLTSTRI